MFPDCVTERMISTAILSYILLHYTVQYVTMLLDNIEIVNC